MFGREKSSNSPVGVGTDRAVSGGLDVYAVSRPARVIVTPVTPPMIHPLSKRDIQRVLSVLPETTTAGLRSVSLLGDRWTPDGLPVMATYRRQGFLRLHSVSHLPWRLSHLPGRVAVELSRYGARLEMEGDSHVVTWDRPALRLFYVTGVLMPGLARHRREQEGYSDSSPVVRAMDDAGGPWVVTETAMQQWAAFLSESEG